MGEERPAFKSKGEETDGFPTGLQTAFFHAKRLAMRGWHGFRKFVNRLDGPRILRRLGIAMGALAGLSLAGIMLLFLVLAAIEPAVTPAPPPAVASTTFVFENGETGQRQIFRDDRRRDAPLSPVGPASMPYDRDIP